MSLAVCVYALRVMTNPAVTGSDALSRRDAWDAVDTLMTDSRVRFLSEHETLPPLWKAFSKKDARNHLLWTDDYLAALAPAIDADLVTLDRVSDALLRRAHR